MTRKIPNDNQIVNYFHCGLCVAEKPAGQSPAEYQKIQAGFTPLGVQVWCTRHNVNLVHIDFEGAVHPANTSRKRLPGEGSQMAKEDENGIFETMKTGMRVEGRRVQIDANRSVFLGRMSGEEMVHEGVSYPNLLETVGATGKTMRIGLSDEAIEAVKTLLGGGGEDSHTVFGEHLYVSEILWSALCEFDLEGAKST